MLKVRNHRDGFQDSMNGEDSDGKNFIPKSRRSQDLSAEYVIDSQAKEKEFEINPGDQLILPLFVGTGELLSSTGQSRNPVFSEEISQVTQLELSNAMNLSWSIMAMSGSQSLSLSGTGNINPASNGIISLRGVDCIFIKDEATGETQRKPSQTGDCSDVAGYENASIKQAEEYVYQITGRITDFLGGKEFGLGTQKIHPNTKDPYLIIRNADPTARKIKIKTNAPFTLPEYSVTATSRKGDAMQVFQFQEDKSGLFDILKN